MCTLEPPSPTALVYSIAGCSEHSGKYVAENIMIDSPADQASRWSGAQLMPHVKQWVLLRLEKLSVVQSITFGKFHKQHPCNVKEFKVYVGTSEDHMTEVLHSGLKNDSIPETFPVRHINESGVYFPTRFVKIVPLSAHGQSFHSSIWYVSMAGITDEAFLDQVRTNYDRCRETIALRHVLKHLRQRRLLTPYESILSRANINLEHPLVTQLHRQVVLEGSWSATEATIQEASQIGLFDEYQRSCQPRALWKRLNGTDADGDAPSARGGHAMCIDVEHRLIYLFGGWDGQRSLDDFWVYDIDSDSWKILSHSTSEQKNGPGARSCHKMVYDQKNDCIYVLGRLSDADALKSRSDTPRDESGTSSSGRPGESSTTNGESSGPVAFCSEFYRYHTRSLDAGTWDLLSFDTATSGGPPLIYDHQMVIDSNAQMLYVFGGRIVDGEWGINKYSGLYSYNIRTSKWKILQPPDTTGSLVHNYIPLRFGHSMILSPSTQELYIFGGQREEKYLSDMHIFNLPTKTATELFANFSMNSIGGPDPCFTQRAVVDPDLGEIYVFCGLTRNQQISAPILRSDAPYWMFRFHPRPGTWAQILRSEQEGKAEPQPRYAHQAVYDPRSKTVFIHGGNAGVRDSEDSVEEKPATEISQGTERQVEEANEEKEREAKDYTKRLDDFWCMTLERPAPEEVVRRVTYHIRRQQFREMCEEVPPVKALNFLQTEVSAVVNHSDPEETSIFRSLLSHLLAPRPSPKPCPPSSSSNWTNTIDEDEVMADLIEHPGTCPMDKEDPEERAVRGEDAIPLSAERFQERTNVFEELLQFVNESAKQPSGSLLDLVSGVGGV